MATSTKKKNELVTRAPQADEIASASNASDDEPAAERPYFFVSYPTSERSRPAALAGRLKDAGLRHFKRPRDLDDTGGLPTHVQRALQRATHLILLIGEDAAASPATSYLLGYAHGRDMKVVPYLLDSGASLPVLMPATRAVLTPTTEARFLRRWRRADHGSSELDRSSRVEEKIRLAVADLESKERATQDEALRQLIRRKAGAELIAALEHPRADVRSQAARGVAKLRLTRALPILVDGLRRMDTSRQPVIPEAESCFRPYGHAAVLELLAGVRAELRDDERRRLITALASVINERCVTDVLERVEEGELWLIEAVIRSGCICRLGKTQELLERFLDEHDDRVAACRTAADWLLDSSLRDNRWARLQLRRWLKDACLAVPAEADFATWRDVAEQADKVLAAGAIDPPDVAVLAGHVASPKLRQCLEILAVSREKAGPQRSKPPVT